MRLETFGEVIQEEKEPIYLRFRKTDTGVAVVACDRNGDPHHAGKLVEIRNDGRLYCYSWINTELGFQLRNSNTLVIKR